MNTITKTFGDTRRIVMRVLDNFEPLPLVGWTGFQLLIGDTADGNARIVFAGFIVDQDEGRIAFPPNSDLEVGSYYYNCRAIDGNGEITTLGKGRYLVSGKIDEV